MSLSRALDALFPTVCIGCAARGVALCDACLPPRALARERLPGLDLASLGAYRGPLRRAVLAYKSGRRDVGDELARRLAAALGGPPGGDVLVPVPTTARRGRARGFDPGERLARRLGAELGVPVLLPLRQRAGDAQRGRTRAERLATRGRFAVDAPGLLAGVAVVLVDDVATTGGTLRDCAAALRAAAARVSGAVVLARA